MFMLTYLYRGDRIINSLKPCNRKINFMNKKIFREDLNGLRAIAVLSVIFFHFNKDWLPGGFIGVDIFFVISGFLMTSIVVGGINNDNFSIVKFYFSRAKRIIPALMGLVLILLIYGYLFLEPLSYKILGEHSFSSLLFYSNITYNSEAGYFDISSYDKFLLHTWSLSVEWQFYIIYPIVLYGISKVINKKNLKYIIPLLLSISFIISIYYSYHNKAASYFLVYTRSWEMLAGGMAFIFPLKIKNKKIIEAICLIVICVSFFVINENDAWPGFMALLPVTSSYLILVNDNKKSLLAITPLKYTGLLSYSIYLFHWPVLVIYNKSSINISIVEFIVITLLLSTASYFLIERKRDYSYKTAIIYFAILTLAFSVARDGFSSRVSKDFQLDRHSYRWLFEGHAGFPLAEGVQFINGNESDFDYILVGDSHARHYFSYILDSNIKVASLALDGCTSTKNYYMPSDKDLCKNRYQQEINFINEHPGKPVIITRLWPGIGHNGIQRDTGNPVKNKDLEKIMVDELIEFINSTKDTRHKYYVIGDTQGSKKIMFECLAKQELPINKIFNIDSCESHQYLLYKSSNAKLKEMALNNSNIEYIDPTPALCDESTCLVVDGTTPIYTDTTHLSRHGAKIVGDYIFNEINK